jgi:hypothetical protein
LIFHNKLPSQGRIAGAGFLARAEAMPAESKTARNWPERSILAGLLLFAWTPLAGCGHATVPCPTPTSELDRLRDETEAARAETDRAEAEEEALEARRDAAAEGVAAAQAALDSLEARPGR